MNTQAIDAIFLDLGNTLRMLVKDETHMAQARRRIAELVGTDEDPEVFCVKLDERYKDYRKWAFETLIEAPESELWTRWLVPDFPAEKIAPLGPELTFQYRQSMGRRVVVEGAREVIEELRNRGYILGIISNLIGTREIPDWLEEDGFAPYFKSVVLSSIFGRRKPDPLVYHEAARRAGVEPGRCAYVGDNPKRDVAGTRQAGFGMIILMMTPEKLGAEPVPAENQPDLIVHEFRQLLDVFPERGTIMNRATGRGALSLAKAVQELYSQGQTDYSLEPVVLVDDQDLPLGCIQDGDAVIFCCRRGEREVQLTEAFTDQELNRFPRRAFENLPFAILTLYHEKFKDLPVAFAPRLIPDTLGEIASRAGLRQLRVSESEKFAHVTFFFNGGRSQPFPDEEDICVPSPRGIPYEQVPELSLAQVCTQALSGIARQFDLIVVNFANGDAIGHTQNRQAKICCAEFVDMHLGQVIDAALAAGYLTLVTADHGNLETLLHLDGSPHVSHTDNPVPFLLLDPQSRTPVRLRSGRLADIAPTILQALGLSQPEAMDGASLALGSPWLRPRRILLIILDGWGIGSSDDNNPIYLASTPVWDRLTKCYPFVHLQAAGEAVGLQPGKAGNSEAGHINIGAGRVALQDDTRLDLALQDNSFYSNEILSATIQGVRERGTRLHLIGLLSEKSSHGSIEYPLALLRMSKARNLQDVFLHVIFDGRSTEPGSAPDLLQKLENQIAEIGIGKIASGMGRAFALDRDGNYKKTQRAYDAMVSGTGKKCRAG